jgi:hypothetical protein
MQCAFITFLLLTVIGQASVRTVWVLHYHYNRVLYIKNCENKSRPELQCNGKCYLKKKMALNTDNKAGEPILPESFSQIKDIQLFFPNAQAFLLHIADDHDERIAFPPYLTCLTSLPKANRFKPPAGYVVFSA